MKYKKIVLKNGLRIITVPMHETQTVTVMIMVGVGSRYETEKEAGISHFIEHMFFKGTKKRPTTLHISEELDAIGGEFNAFTAKDKTMYFAKVDSKHVSTALDVVCDIYLNSKIDEKEIERERGTILQELNMYEDTPTRNVSDVFETMLYPDPLGREIIGSKKTLMSFRRKDFADYMERFYRANDTVVCVAGKFNEKDILNKIKKYFGQMEVGKKPKIVKVFENQKKSEIKIKFKKTDQTHFVLGTRAYDFNHKDRFALALLSIILGGSMSSRLFIEVREKRGLAYYVRTMVESYEDVGYIATQAGVEHKNLELAVKTILAEYKKISQEKVNSKELQKAKDYIKGKTVMGMEASDEVAMFFIDQEVMKKKITALSDKFKLIDKVTEDDIMRVAKDVFRNEKLNLAVIGPHKDKSKLEKTIKL
ncbi:MAG TPA: pitrilysin family protein [Candidatus Moranbacteria bacterium]|nr:pitrilysin family protein [Candidatus Moranbacteria bacterium]